jgi:hypothetical protein
MTGCPVSLLFLMLRLESNGRAVYLLKKKAVDRRKRAVRKEFDIAESPEGKFMRAIIDTINKDGERRWTKTSNTKNCFDKKECS